MSPTVSYRLFNSYDKSSILNLMKFIYPDYPYDEAYYTWQYLRNPAGESRIFLAECEGEIVGMYCLIPNTIELGARHCKIWRVQNVMMRPDFRMKGTFFELMMAAQQHQSWLDTDFFFAFPNENSFRSFEKFGYVVQNDVIFFEMNRHPKHEILQQYQITIANNFSFLDDSFFKALEPQPNHLSISKHSDFLTWRYIDRPGAFYKIFIIKENRLPVGYMVIKKYTNERKIISNHICELKVIADNKEMILALMCYAINNMLQDGAELLNLFASSPNTKSVIEGLAFVQKPSERKIVFHTGKNNQNELSKKLMFSLGDNDVF